MRGEKPEGPLIRCKIISRWLLMGLRFVAAQLRRYIFRHFHGVTPIRLSASLRPPLAHAPALETIVSEIRVRMPRLTADGAWVG